MEVLLERGVLGSTTQGKQEESRETDYLDRATPLIQTMVLELEWVDDVIYVPF